MNVILIRACYGLMFEQHVSYMREYGVRGVMQKAGMTHEGLLRKHVKKWDVFEDIGSRAGFCLSIYNTGGTFAFALGPVFITWYVAGFGLEQMPYTIIFGAIAFIFCLKYLPIPVSENLSHLGFLGSLKETLGKVYKPIFLIWLVMVLRAVTGQTFMTFMPIYLTDKGHSLVSVGLIVSLFILAGTFSGLLAGYMADKTDFKKIFFVSHAFMAPALLLYLYLPGPFVYL